VDGVLDSPAQEYTKTLIASIPVPDPARRQRSEAAAT
jgi:ABC-type oligopeptide transport system ATPase subunit